MNLLTERFFDNNRFKVRTLAFSSSYVIRDFIQKEVDIWQVGVKDNDFIMSSTKDTTSHTTVYKAYVVSSELLVPVSDADYDYMWKYLNIHYPDLLSWLKVFADRKCPVHSTEKKTLPVSTWELINDRNVGFDFATM